MADLTLDEFRGVSKEELGQILKEEAQKMFCPDSVENNLVEKRSICHSSNPDS